MCRSVHQVSLIITRPEYPDNDKSRLIAVCRVSVINGRPRREPVLRPCAREMVYDTPWVVLINAVSWIIQANRMRTPGFVQPLW